MIIEKTFSSNSSPLTILYRTSVCDVHGEYQEIGMLNQSKEGYEKWRGCSACHSENNQLKAKRDQMILISEKQREIEKLFDQAGIPSEYADSSFDNYVIEANPDAQKRALSMAKDFSVNLLSGQKFKGMLILSGSAGTGKTHLSCAIANAAIKTKNVMFLTHYKLIIEMSDSQRFGSKMQPSDLIKKLEKIDLLIIDEFGTSKPSDNAASAMMFEVLNGRYSNGKPTVFLTNLDLNGMRLALTERVMDRIKEVGVWCDMNWESYRPKKRLLSSVNQLNNP